MAQKSEEGDFQIEQNLAERNNRLADIQDEILFDDRLHKKAQLRQGY